jgi:hypothetical protein
MVDEEPFPERPRIDGEGRVLERPVEQLDRRVAILPARFADRPASIACLRQAA